MSIAPPSLRGLLKAPGFSLVIILTLALGIGANVGVFSIIYAVLIQPLPYQDAGRIVTLFESKVPNDTANPDEVSPADFVDWQQRNHSFTAIAASHGWFGYNLTGDGPPEHVFGAAVSASLFPLLGVQPAIGRTFLPEEDEYQAPNVVILSHQLWMCRFGGDKSIVNRAISINGQSYTVVGVMPSGWNYPEADDQLWVPLAHQVRPDRMRWRSARFLRVIGRLRPGVTLDQARAEMNAISTSIQAGNPGTDVDGGVALVPFRESLVSGQRPNLLLSLGVAGIVLLIACTNAANLMLVRVAGKARDLAVRMALGASLSQVLRQPLLEGLWLGISAGVVGIVFAIGGKHLLLALAPDHADQFQLIALKPAVLTFALLLSVLVGVVFGLAPAVAILRSGLHDLLRKASKAVTVDLSGRRLRNGIAVTEIALSVLLLTGAGLLIRSLTALQHVPLGVNPEHVVTAKFALSRIKYQDDRDVVTFYQRAIEQARLIPGVEDAALTTEFPLSGGSLNANIEVSGTRIPSQNSASNLAIVDAHYFPVISVPILSGRNFSDSDGAGSAPVAVVNRAFVRQFLPGEDAVGRQVTVSLGNDPQRHFMTIVGVAGNVRTEVDSDAAPTVYVPHPQITFHTLRMVLQTERPLADLERALQSTIQEIDPSQTVFEVNYLKDEIAGTLEPWEYALLLMGTLAGLALLLTVVGVFAVISSLVRERTKELGIRIALGATSRSVLVLVLSVGLRLSATGVLLGLIISAALTRLMHGLIYGISPADPATFAGVALTLTLTALLASYLPARRAACIDAVEALSDE